MKQIPKGLSMLTGSVDKTLAGGILAVALIGGASMEAYSADIMGGENLLLFSKLIKSYRFQEPSLTRPASRCSAYR